jgi:formylglycine-generating enzyme required for sulfatase activity
VLAIGVVLLLAQSCKKPPPPAPSTEAGAGTDAAATALIEDGGAAITSDAASADTGAAGDGAPTADGFPPARTEGCPDGMVRVEGEYCVALMQDCLVHHKEYEANKENKNVSERCLKYKAPSRCVVKPRQQMSFCMDRFEWPNKVGEMPRVLTSWLEARILCQRAGKRLCTEDEHNFACEGPEMLPYAYGYDRDETKCNIDKFYHQPDHSKQMLTYEKCLKDEWCSGELKRLDQRHAIGSRLTCVSWAGVVDINGNVNEWVELPGKKPPNRSGLKGGWWGPVRNRCRPTVEFHKEGDYGYEAGFRCCTGVQK